VLVPPAVLPWAPLAFPPADPPPANSPAPFPPRYYGRRYVGELSLLEPGRDTLRFSVLDMWGNREDVDVPLRGPFFTPPFRNMPNKVIEHICNQLLFPVNCEVPGEGRRQFYVSVVAGQLLQGRLFMELLRGEYVPPGGGGGGSGGGGSGSRSGSGGNDGRSGSGSGSGQRGGPV
jgi:uncharacterized membrane protein YgcG